LLKKTHANNDKTNVKHEKLRATCFNKDWFDDGMGIKEIAPNKGNNKI
tara:strand:- start:2730 stop:2873 length:144 start_codon:yes stop_codon:yes gene_type:complete